PPSLSLTSFPYTTLFRSRIDGMNEKGLVIGYNFTHTKKSGDGFMCSMIARLILETCADTREAAALLKEIPHRHSFSYVVQDKRKDRKSTRLNSSHVSSSY